MSTLCVNDNLRHIENFLLCRNSFRRCGFRGDGVGKSLVKRQDDGKDSYQDQDQSDVSVQGRVIFVHESSPN